MSTDYRDSNNDNDSESQPVTSPGALLKNARQRAGLSQRQVAESLRLLPEQIRFLEQDQYQRFNSPLFYKAHLKACARLLQLNADELMALYLQSIPSTEPVVSISSHVADIQRPRRGHSLRYWALGVVALVSVMLWMSEQQDKTEPVTAVTTVVDSNDQSTLRVLGGQGLESAAQLDSLPVRTAALTEVDSTEFVDQEEGSVIIDLPASASPAAAESRFGSTEANPAQVADAADTDVLKFKFADDCWVEVKDGAGEVIFASLKRASDTLELSGTGPFKVLLGYAHGVSLDYNGRPVEINVNRRTNSARLVVGNLPVN